MKKTFLMLCQTYNPKKHFISGWYVSQKLDGIRAFWDGGISGGIATKEIKWANVEKDSRLINKPIATGLWSRHGKVIHAPDWWLEKLPNVPLDGEIWHPDGWQELSKIVKRFDKGDGWKDVGYYVFDSPSYEKVFEDGIINEINFKKVFSGVGEGLVGRDIRPPREFESNYNWLRNKFEQNEVFNILEQRQLSFNSLKAKRELEEYLDKFGEVVIRDHWSVWTPQRSWSILKYKDITDSEAIVTGYVSGKGKYEGMMGALVTSFFGKRLELSGFTDEERRLCSVSGKEVGDGGVELSEDYYSEYFPRGSMVTIRYRELSDSGIPKECRFLRTRSYDQTY